MWKFCTLPFTPANICWSWWRFQHVFRVKILRLPRRHKDVLRLAKTSLKTSCKIHEDVFKTSWKTKNCYAEDMSWRRLEDMFWRPLKDFMETNKILTGDICILISGFNKPKCVSNKSVFHKSISDNSKANPKCINYWWLVWCYEISLIQIRHCRKGETIKTNF